MREHSEIRIGAEAGGRTPSKCDAIGLWRVHGRDPNYGESARIEPQRPRRTKQQVDDPPARIRAAIVDPDQHDAPSRQRRQPQIGRQRQRQLRGAHRAGAEAFAIDVRLPASLRYQLTWPTAS